MSNFPPPGGHDSSSRRSHRILLSFAAVVFVTSVAAAVVGVDGGHTQRAAAADAPAELALAAPTTTTSPAVAAVLPSDSEPTATTSAPAPNLPRTSPVSAPARKPNPKIKTGEIRIPKIGLVHAYYEGVTLDILDEGPGHWPGSALPGQLGNAVYAGHRVTHSHPFRNLDDLVAGDEIRFVDSTGEYLYKVTKQEIVGAKDTWIVNPTPDATLTLFACHPPGSAKQRIVVRGVYAGRVPGSGGVT